MLAALLGMLLKFEAGENQIYYCLGFTRLFMSQLCQLIHQRFDIAGILKDKILQSIHIQDIWKRYVDQEFTTETFPPLRAMPSNLN